MQIESKVFAVTGAGQGIGEAIAQALASKGGHLALLDVSAQELERVSARCREYGVSVRTYICNVADADAVVQTFERVGQDFGRLDGLVNNAGITRDALLVKAGADGRVVKTMTLAQWQQVIDVDLTGAFLCGREAAAKMIDFANGGVIINISSIARAGNVGQSNYSAAKAGLAAMTVTWAKELGRYGIRAASIAPGFIRTDILSSMPDDVKERLSAQVPLHRFGEASEVAHTTVYLVENDYFSGRTIELDGGWRI